MKIESIFHPSDFTAGSEVAFAHALMFALVARAELNVLHVAAGAGVDWRDFPGVRDTLARWKLIPEGSPASALAALGITVRKVVMEGDDPVEASAAFLQKHAADLVVLAVRQRDGRMRWFERSVGASLAQRAGQMTLFIPGDVAGFVSLRDGSVSLDSILVPVASTPRPGPAVDAAARLIRNLGLPAGTVTFLHVGAESEMPAVRFPDDTGWATSRVVKSGDPAEAIVECASDVNAGLVVMTTDGPDGFLDALRGSTSERVLRRIRCPVAHLPAGSLLG